MRVWLKWLAFVLFCSMVTGGLISEAQVSIRISPEIRHQEMVGFGAALSWYMSFIYRGDAEQVAALEQAMFADSGLDILRLKNWYYPDDSDGGNAMNLHGINQRLAEAAKAANPDIEILYSSWSPPEALKSNGDRRNGGTLAKDGEGNFMYDALADYWVEVLDNLGWTPDYLSFQNEPGWVAAHETCVFDPVETSSNAGYVQAADAIWDAIKDHPDAPKMVGSEAENMPAFFNFNQQLLSRPYFAVHGYHVYDIGNAAAIDSSTTIDRMRRIRDDFGDRPNWQTEFSRGFGWIDTARVIHNTLVEANASAYIYWKLAWQPTSDTMIAMESNGDYTIEPPYYTIKHYARHVHKGYVRIEVAGSTADVRVSGFLSPEEDSITLVAINRGTTAQSIDLDHDALRIEALAGYQSVEGNFYQEMTGLDAESPIALPASSITTIVLTLADEPSMAVYEGDTLIPSGSERVFLAPLAIPVSHTYVVTNRSTALATLLLTNMPSAVVFEENHGTNYNGLTIFAQTDGWWSNWRYGAVAEMIFTDGTEDLAMQQRLEGYLMHGVGFERIASNILWSAGAYTDAVQRTSSGNFYHISVQLDE